MQYNKLLNQAVSTGKAKEYYGAYIIYPRAFNNDLIFNALLRSLLPDFTLYRIMDAIKAIPKRA